MMDVPLTIDLVVDRAERWMGDVEVVSRRPDRSLTRTTYGAIAKRARQLARALVAAGIQPGRSRRDADVEPRRAPRGVLRDPARGRGASHTLNLRLHPDEIAYIANDAGDRFADRRRRAAAAVREGDRRRRKFEKVIVVGDAGGREAYEAFLAGAPDRRAAAAARDTTRSASATRAAPPGKPKGVVYTHRSTLLHSLVAALPDSLDVVARRHAAAGGADVPRQRVGPAVRRARWSARSSCSRGRTSTRRACST